MMQVRKAFAVFFWIVSFIALLCVIAFAWIFRDGLGPGVVDSHGMVALRRMFDCGMTWGLGVFVIPPAVIGCLLHPWRSQKAA